MINNIIVIKINIIIIYLKRDTNKYEEEIIITIVITIIIIIINIISSVRSSYSHPDLLVITTTPLLQITPVLNTGLSLSEPLQLYKGYNAI